MPRAKRAVIDHLDEIGFENIGRSWTHRENWVSYGDRPVPVEQDRFTLDIPTFAVPGGGFYTQVTIWSTGLVSFGAVTAEQIAYMAGLNSGTDLAAFLAAFPGDFVATGFQATAYAQVEFATGVHDPVGDPFGSDGVIGKELTYDRSDAELICYAAFGGRPIAGTPDDDDLAPTVTVLGDHIGVNFTGEGFRVAAPGTYHLGDATVTLAKNDFVYFSDLNVWVGTDADDVQVATAPQTLDGAAGADRLAGGDGADHLLGGKGDDQLTGGGGVDRLDGGDGDDVLGDGDERGTILGGRGADVITSGRGDDVIDGGSGVDTLVLDYSTSEEAIVMSLDRRTTDYQIGGEYKQIRNVEALLFTGGAGRDMIDGGSGGDLLRQRGGGGRLQGRDGDDTLVGGTGEDVLVGGSGADRMSGLGGADTFVFRSLHEITGPDGRSDAILDFQSDDKISLRAIGEAFAFIGGAAFTGTGQAEVRTETMAEGRSVVLIDGDGDAQADAQLLVLTAAPLTAENFIL